MLELADRHDSGSCVCTHVRVQVPFPALETLYLSRFIGMVRCFFVAKARQANEVLAHQFICRAKEQRAAMQRAVRLQNRVGASLLDCKKIGAKYL